MALDDARFYEVFNRLERYIEDRYGVPVVLTDLPASPCCGW